MIRCYRVHAEVHVHFHLDVATVQVCRCKSTSVLIWYQSGDHSLRTVYSEARLRAIGSIHSKRRTECVQLVAFGVTMHLSAFSCYFSRYGALWATTSPPHKRFWTCWSFSQPFLRAAIFQRPSETRTFFSRKARSLVVVCDSYLLLFDWALV